MRLGGRRPVRKGRASTGGRTPSAASSEPESLGEWSGSEPGYAEEGTPSSARSAPSGEAAAFAEAAPGRHSAQSAPDASGRRGGAAAVSEPPESPTWGLAAAAGSSEQGLSTPFKAGGASEPAGSPEATLQAGAERTPERGPQPGSVPSHALRGSDSETPLLPAGSPLSAKKAARSPDLDNGGATTPEEQRAVAASLAAGQLVGSRQLARVQKRAPPAGARQLRRRSSAGRRRRVDAELARLFRAASDDVVAAAASAGLQPAGDEETAKVRGALGWLAHCCACIAVTGRRE